MQIHAVLRDSARRLTLATLFVSLAYALSGGSVLEAQQSCTCATTSPFGSCFSKRATYPDQFPGAATVVDTASGKFLYVADLYSGYTYRFTATNVEQGTPVKFVSPKASNATTGLAALTGETSTVLVWAIENRLYQTNLEGQDAVDMGQVQLTELATALRADTGDTSIARGSLGGITYHAGRGTLWGVDIVNDVYFEFDLTGRLVLEGGKPRYFLSPARDRFAGGAYGNSIAYVAADGGEYFDLPVGTLAEGRPSRVVRVHASDGTAPLTHRIGDGAGLAYELGTALATPKFVTGVAYWAESCGTGQASEFVLDLDQVGGNPRIIEVAVDPPASANVAAFACTNSESSTVRLTWKKTRAYTTLTITRQDLGKTGSTAVTVFEGAAFESDPEEFTDTGLVDSLYEYVATVTAEGSVAPVSCRVNVGPGNVIAFRSFLGRGSVSDPTPFALAVVDSAALVIVADLNTGDAETFDLDLNRVGTIDGPITSGLTTGLAHGVFPTSGSGTEDRLYWLRNENGKHSIIATSLTGQPLGNFVTLSNPTNLQTGVLLGSIAYDSVRGLFWAVDLQNLGIYPFGIDGKIPTVFRTRQIPSPEPGGYLGGGVALIQAEDATVTLGMPVGAAKAGRVDAFASVRYDAANPATAGAVLGRFDLRYGVGAGDIAGAAVSNGAEKFLYLTAIDTRGVYKLRFVSDTSGLVSFRRGDANNDTVLTISDPSFILQYLFRQGTEPPCLQAADANASGSIEITDAIQLFTYLFKGGAAPPAPFPECGFDLQSPLACAQSICN